MPDSTKPLVSILINNYNYGRFLGAAIESALNQTYQPTEVIVVDDGSTDGSRDVMGSFGDRIRSLFKKNGGQASAYNAGFQACSGEFIHFLDSDDLLTPNAIEEATRAWEPGVAKVHFYLRVIEGAEGTRTESLLPASKLAVGDVRGQIANGGWYTSPPASGNLYWRPSLERIFPMPEEEWITAADTYPIFLAPLSGQVRACSTVLGFYRVHGANKDAQTEVSVGLLRYRMQKEAHRDALFTKMCPAAGVAYLPGAVENHLSHMKVRLCSLALDPAGHPHRGDRLLATAWRTTTMCWEQEGWPVSKKLLFAVWVAAVVITPAALISRIVNVAFVPTKRWKFVQSWLSRSRKSESEMAIPLRKME